MGFSAIPPRFDQAVLLQSLDLWTSSHADAAIMHISVPWAALLGGIPAAQEITGNELGLANYYRARQLELVVTIDVTNGLNRAAEDPTLDSAGRSITDTAIQRMYRDLFVSVQVEVAWGRLQGGGYTGIAQDLADFPFVASLVVEGGWSSVSLGTFTSSPAVQARYLAHQPRLLDSARAIGLFQLTFADLDLSAIPVPPGSILPLFAHLGVVDSALGPKPALATWDSILARPLVP